MATLLLIRHAEPALRGVFLGQMDPPLSDAGRAHAMSALANLEPAIAYCSPLQRARETAVCLRARQIKVIEELREIHQGEWTGKTWLEIESSWTALAAQKQSDWLGCAPPGGESWPHFLARIQIAWQIIRKGPQPAAVVGHQAVNAALASLAAGFDPLAFFQHYGEVTSVEYGED